MLTNAHLTDRIDVLIHFPQDGGVMWNLNTPPQFGSSMVDFCAIHHLREGFIMFHLHVGWNWGPNMAQSHKCAIFFFLVPRSSKDVVNPMLTLRQCQGLIYDDIKTVCREPDAWHRNIMKHICFYDLSPPKWFHCVASVLRPFRLTTPPNISLLSWLSQGEPKWPMQRLLQVLLRRNHRFHGHHRPQVLWPAFRTRGGVAWTWRLAVSSGVKPAAGLGNPRWKWRFHEVSSWENH